MRRKDVALELDRLQPMTTRIAITADAYAAIRESVPPAGSRPPQMVGGLYLVSLPNAIMDELVTERRQGESFSDTIIRLANDERR
jgi:hypothetical protein